MEFKFIGSASCYDELTGTMLHKFLDGLMEGKKRRMLLSQITKIVFSNVYVSMKVHDARARMKMLLITYKDLPKQIIIDWVLEPNP